MLNMGALVLIRRENDGSNVSFLDSFGSQQQHVVTLAAWNVSRCGAFPQFYLS